MSDKLREEFAAWYLAELAQSYGEGVRAQAQKNLEWTREDGSFADPMLRLACLAWQASRAAVVVELPARVDAKPYACYEGGWNDMHDEARDAIEAAGGTVKP